MTISILGCGWFGEALARVLLGQGVMVKGSTTSPEKLEALAGLGIQPYLIDLRRSLDSEAFQSFLVCDVLVVSIPPRLRQQPATNFILCVEHLIAQVKQCDTKRVIFISSTSVYGDTGINVTEHDTPVPDSDSGKVLLAAERLFVQEQDVFKTTVIRFGGLIGPGRHPGRFFAGKKDIGNGLAPVNLIHLTDCIGICLTVIYKRWYGYILNACAPQHPTRKTFYTQASQDAGLEVPEFIDERVAWKVVDSVYLQAVLGYVFQEAIA